MILFAIGIATGMAILVLLSLVGLFLFRHEIDLPGWSLDLPCRPNWETRSPIDEGGKE